MNQEFETELSPEERQSFDRLPREKVPPSALEERVVQLLKQSGLISHAQKIRKWNLSHIGVAAAASLLFFFVGAAVTKWLSSPTPTTNPAEFMLILHQPGPSRHSSREEELRAAKEYGAWARQLNQQGVITDGEKLKDETRILRIIDGRTVASENAADLSGSNIAGYFLIKAKSYAQAMQLAESCPHLKAGGTIEVREIDRFE